MTSLCQQVSTCDVEVGEKRKIGRLHLIPIITFFWMLMSIGISYITAVILSDIPSLYPYVSDTGTFSPESCIFGQCLNIGSILFAAVVYLRYRQVRYICENHNIAKDTRTYNRISVWLGLLAAVGVSVVANFQETNLLLVHLLGATMAFGFGNVYMVTSTISSFKIFPIIGSKFTNTLRIMLILLCGATTTIGSVSGLISFLLFDGNDFTKWSKHNGGYSYHVISSIAEWIATFTVMTYIASYSNDFKLLSMEEPPIFVVDVNVIAQSASPESQQRHQ